MRFGWFIVGAVSGIFGGAVINEWKHTKCSCVQRKVLDGNAVALLPSEVSGLEEQARNAMQYAQQWGMDALNQAQIDAIDAWDMAKAELVL